ncbi:NHL repeat-containing protein [Photobacterium sp. TY1-4]|uniref:NHL repeat-containing protein n=1 Tax=Photobacterium sp. TY1-4 TaxID=2899122 RepID=UPI0021C1F39E|nr:NHL repeat-containing protein [Photobacterium sp. TY1-4]UXI04413.1 NHL repeat-containing protein [Photobacterium sp. TY1-4]
MGIEFQSYIGRVVERLPELPCAVEGNVSFNTPVGSCVDRYGNLWLADTAHNRILIFDYALEQVIGHFGTIGSGPQAFNMPFRLLAHPEQPWIYVSDIGNRRIHLLTYDEQLNITSQHCFGDEPHVQLQGPNGLAFYQGELCVADEFYEGEGGASRLVVFSETGEYRRSIHQIEGPDGPIHLLWPQGLSLDQQGALYIANTGFATVVRCDWQGQGLPFEGTQKCYIDGLALARDVAVIQNRILIPGAEPNAISVYDLEGRLQGVLDGFFAPIQVTSLPEKNRLLITEPILASLQVHQVHLPSLKDQTVRATKVLQRIGDERDNPGQFHFVTAVAGQMTDNQSSSPRRQPFPLLESWLNHQLGWQDKLFQAMQPAGMPSWFSLAVAAQTEWVQRWQQTWLRILLNDKFDDPEALLWMVDAGNYQLQASDSGQADSASPISLPLLPGSLGIAAYTPRTRLPGQVDASVPMMIVGNYLSGIVSVFQYDPRLGELIPYTFFGGLGAEPWQLNKPQGIEIDPVTNDIFIADSGNNRIARWRINALGIAGLVEVFGRLGDGHGQFHTPTDITVIENGDLYITDQTNNRIEIYDNQHRWIGSFGQEGYGTRSDDFLLPTSIDYDGGYLFISDLVNRAIKVFQPDGTFVDSFCGFGADPDKGQLWMPYLMHVRKGRVYLPDCALNRINVYRFHHLNSHEEVPA